MGNTKKVSTKTVANKDNILLSVEKDSDYKYFFFNDIGIGIHICKDYVVASSNFHQHVWNRITSNGISVPCAFLEQLVDIAIKHKNEIAVKSEGETHELVYSLTKLVADKSLSESEKIIVTYVEMFLYILNDAPFAINFDAVSRTGLWARWFSWISRNNVLLDNKNEDITRNNFFNEYIKLFRFLSLDYNIPIDKLSDFKKKVFEIEDNAYSEIQKNIINNGGSLSETLATKDITDGHGTE